MTIHTHSPKSSQVTQQTRPILILRSGLALGLALGLLFAGVATYATRIINTHTNAPNSNIQSSNYLSSYQTSIDMSTSFEPKNELNPDADIMMRECIILLNTGRRITGEFIREDSLIVVIGINGINTTFQRDQVAAVTILPPVLQRYEQMRSAIPDDDYDARLVLTEWLRSRKAYSLALKELNSLLIDDPSNARAKLLHTWLSEFVKLSQATPNEANTSSQNADKITDQIKPTKPKRSKRPLRNTFEPLTTEQINLLRVYEIDLSDPPKLRVPDEVLRILMQRKPNEFSPNENERNKIFRLREIEKLKIVFSLKARDLYNQIEVLEDPASVSMFKQSVHSQRGWIINACASTRCHGGPDAGAFKLLNTRPNSDETSYSNLFILEHYTLENGLMLINFEDPERSPLLQIGLPRTGSLSPHPEIPKGYPGRGFRPIFRSTRDRKYREAIEWINSMYQPRPEYPFEYRPQSKPESDSPSSSNPSTPELKP